MSTPSSFLRVLHLHIIWCQTLCCAHLHGRPSPSIANIHPAPGLTVSGKSRFVFIQSSALKHINCGQRAEHLPMRGGMSHNELIRMVYMPSAFVIYTSTAPPGCCYVLRSPQDPCNVSVQLPARVIEWLGGRLNCKQQHWMSSAVSFAHKLRLLHSMCETNFIFKARCGIFLLMEAGVTTVGERVRDGRETLTGWKPDQTRPQGEASIGILIDLCWKADRCLEKRGHR